MKIVHICLLAIVTDGWSYQDNLLPKFHKKLGLDVTIVTSRKIYDNKGEITLDSREEYFNENNVKVRRLVEDFNKHKRLVMFRDLYKVIKEENPDILFVHGVQFLDIITIVKYLKENPNVRVYVDNHADEINSINGVKSIILNKILWRFMAKQIAPYTSKFYGTLPARVEFLKKYYNIGDHQRDLLIMGADDDALEQASNSFMREKIRKKYNVTDNDTLLVTGGKLGEDKIELLDLIKVIKDLNVPYLKLMIFGSLSKSIQQSLEHLIDGEKIIYIGWISSNDIYEYYKASDIAVFPYRHSVLWEQAVASGIPLLVKQWNGMSHVDIGGNCIFIKEANYETMKINIIENVLDKENFNKLKLAALNEKNTEFLYSTISKKSIEFVD